MKSDREALIMMAKVADRVQQVELTATTDNLKLLEMIIAVEARLAAVEALLALPK